MRGVRLHTTLLALALISAGLGTIYYQSQILQIPLTEGQTDEVWVIDARISYDAGRTPGPTKLRMFVPPSGDRFTVLGESFVSRNYGFNVSRVDGNRQVVWSARRVQGEEVLYYR